MERNGREVEKGWRKVRGWYADCQGQYKMDEKGILK